MRIAIWILATLLAGGQASQKPPQTVTPQTYTPEQIQAGQTRFSSQCGFCHGRDAAGGETGPDLTRSVLVAQDVRGDKISPMLKAGRQEKGMPAFDLGDAEVSAIVAYVHDQKSRAETLNGNRRNVDPTDVETGNADAGRQYFSGDGGCAKCHSAMGDLAGIGTRFQGLALLQRMLYPTAGRPAPAAAKVAVKLKSGETVSGSLVSRDEFTITVKDASNANQSWPMTDVTITMTEPLAAHFEQLGKYTDNDMHNVRAYLQSLR